MAYITRGPRRAATTDVRPVAMREGAVLAEVDFDAVANPAQWSSHADLHDLATGLDFDDAEVNALDTNSEASRLTDQDQQSSTVTNSQTKVASANRVAVVTRTFPRRTDTSALSRNSQTAANVAASAEVGQDNDSALVVPAAIDPFFEPQFKHLVVVLCLLGTFAKPIVRFSRLPIIRRLRRTVTSETGRPDSVPM